LEISMRRLAALSAALALFVSPALAADLAAHRALYDLTLETTPHSNVQAAHGSMSYEVQDACDGWAVRQRLTLDITNGEGQNVELVSDYVTWESKNGHDFRFRMKQSTDTATTQQTEGEANTGPQGGEARYTLPAVKTIKLPTGTLLPMAHTNAIIEAARAGKKFVGLPLFDGTSEKGAQDTNIVILDWKPAGAEGKEWPDLLRLPSTRVHVAFFDRNKEVVSPEYEVGMRYWENGVGDNLRMDFGDFVMDGKIAQFTLLPHRC
jgi:hypothetical protein